MIKAVIFDFFGVVCSDDYWKLVRADKQMRSDFHDLADQVNLGSLSWHDFINTTAKKINQPVEVVYEMYETEKIDPRVLAYIHQLHGKYKTALLTNAHYEFFEPLAERSELSKVFDEIIVSSRVGFVKPSREIFVHTLNKLEVKPEETLFIDDSQANVHAAEALGIRGVFFSNFNESKPKIDKLLGDS